MQRARGRAIFGSGRARCLFQPGNLLRAAFDRSGTNPETMPGKSSCDAPTVALSSTAFDTAPAAGARFEVRASAQGGVGPYTYLWDADGDGVYERSGSSRTIRVSFPTQRQINVRVQVRDAEGCIGAASRAVALIFSLSTGLGMLSSFSAGTPKLFCRSRATPSDTAMIRAARG